MSYCLANHLPDPGILHGKGNFSFRCTVYNIGIRGLSQLTAWHLRLFVVYGDIKQSDSRINAPMTLSWGVFLKSVSLVY